MNFLGNNLQISERKMQFAGKNLKITKKDLKILEGK